ncbi:hypothetical protein DSLASN_27610 [Desulfoluna limicola]|uniref:Uncharacterized protein n=1 Tax=Desulfoluna limicola TaxID=2810562 RepID=A0ABM7PJ58_9BACT|nr:hypothetical protein DSLASN_27610 [Desulfoluna limicola]
MSSSYGRCVFVWLPLGQGGVSGYNKPESTPPVWLPGFFGKWTAFGGAEALLNETGVLWRCLVGWGWGLRTSLLRGP